MPNFVYGFAHVQHDSACRLMPIGGVCQLGNDPHYLKKTLSVSTCSSHQQSDTSQQKSIKYLRDCWQAQYRMTHFRKRWRKLGFLVSVTIMMFAVLHGRMKQRLIVFVTLGLQNYLLCVLLEAFCLNKRIFQMLLQLHNCPMSYSGTLSQQLQETNTISIIVT